MEKNNKINYLLVNKAFERDGWEMHHRFMCGNEWEKGNDKVTCYYGHFKLNGTPVSNEFIREMLHIDLRMIEVSEEIAPHPIDSKYGRAGAGAPKDGGAQKASSSATNQEYSNLFEYNCPSCGAQLVCDETTAATSCP